MAGILKFYAAVFLGLGTFAHGVDVSKPGSPSDTEWKIAAFSMGAPPSLASEATIMDGDLQTVLRAGTNGWVCTGIHGVTAPGNNGTHWADARHSVPTCFDSEAAKFFDGLLKGQPATNMERDGYIWMNAGDLGEDPAVPGRSGNPAATNGGTFNVHGPHVMLVPKDQASLDNFPTDFTIGAPYRMWANTGFQLLMIPVDGFYKYGVECKVTIGPNNDPFAGLTNPDHTSNEWKIAAISSAAPPELAAAATVMDAGGQTVLRAGTNGWTCLPASPPDAMGVYKTARHASPACVDSEGLKFFGGLQAATPATTMTRDSFIWMRAGDLGEDTSVPGRTGKPNEATGPFVVDGPHLMLVPKVQASLDNFPTDFTTGVPYKMWAGTGFQLVMIPITGFYAYYEMEMSKTCGEVKAAYKKSKCCGNPNTKFMMEGSDQMDWRRLAADRRLMPSHDEEDLQFDIHDALTKAHILGGAGKAKWFAEELRKKMATLLLEASKEDLSS